MLHHLELGYSSHAAVSAGVRGGPPARLILKISHNAPLAPGVAPHHGLSTGKEVWFYNHVATEPGMAATPLIRCYAAAHDPPYGGSHALVDDLSATYGQPPLLLPPTGALCAPAVVALAQLHAVWWQHPRLASGGDVADRLEWEREAALAIGRRDPLEGVVPAFLDYLGDRLSAEQRGLYERLLATHARRRELRRARPQTLRHGDAHWWNFLYPNPPALGTTRLLDWGSWRVGVGTDDLAYMIALHGYRAWRGRFEANLLRLYHEALAAAGVRGYDWRACREDYRWSVVDALAVAPSFWSIKVPAFIWWPKVECGLAAFEDHRCVELLDA
jgi:hypothetical protein